MPTQKSVKSRNQGRSVQLRSSRGLHSLLVLWITHTHTHVGICAAILLRTLLCLLSISQHKPKSPSVTSAMKIECPKYSPHVITFNQGIRNEILPNQAQTLFSCKTTGPDKVSVYFRKDNKSQHTEGTGLHLHNRPVSSARLDSGTKLGLFSSGVSDLPLATADNWITVLTRISFWASELRTRNNGH